MRQVRLTTAHLDWPARLRLAGTAMTDRIAPALEQRTGLESLTLQATGVTGGTAVTLGKLPKLGTFMSRARASACGPATPVKRRYREFAALPLDAHGVRPATMTSLPP